jgi:hypothetical protein
MNLLDSLLIVLQVFGKIAWNFSPAIVLFFAFIGIMKVVEGK